MTTFEVAPNGERVRLNAITTDGVRSSISLPLKVLSQLVMTLPRIALAALRRQQANDALRIVYPAKDLKVEQSAEQPGTYILTLSTPDGFEVSFAVNRDKLETIRDAAREAAVIERRAPAVVLN